MPEAFKIKTNKNNLEEKVELFLRTAQEFFQLFGEIIKMHDEMETLVSEKNFFAKEIEEYTQNLSDKIQNLLQITDLMTYLLGDVNVTNQGLSKKNFQKISANQKLLVNKLMDLPELVQNSKNILRELLNKITVDKQRRNKIKSFYFHLDL